MALPVGSKKTGIQPYSRKSKYDKHDSTMYNTSQGGSSSMNMNAKGEGSNTNNINNLYVYNIKLDPNANKDDRHQEDKLNHDNKNKAKTLMTQTMKTDDNFNESLKFIRTIPKIELFDRPRKTIPTKN